MSEGAISEDTFTCGICFELLIDPTTLTCGHTICRYCLAQWWYKSKKNTCPECRQIWHGFPKVNVTLRNTINSLYPNQAKEKSKWLEDTGEYKDIMRKFENYGKATQPSLGSSLNWTYFCILVAIAVAVIVVVSMAVRKLHSSLQKDLMSKSLYDWSPDDVGVWIGSLGSWAETNYYSQKFVDAGIDGSLLSQVTEEDLKQHPINMTLGLHRRILIENIKNLKEKLPNHPTGFWEYKERNSGMTMFIMFGLREFPRSTMIFLYMFNYNEIFLPIFYGTVAHEGNPTFGEIMKMSHSPSLENWIEFLPKLFCVPYYIIGMFAWRFLDGFWTSRVVILHSILMTITEFTRSRYLFSGGLRKLHYTAMKYFSYVLLLSLFFQIVWPFVPFFIADCIFYWMLYVSPFDALNRLRRTFVNRHENNNNNGNIIHHNHHTRHIHGRNNRGWHINLEWNTR